MEDKKLYCHKCATFVTEFFKKRRICADCVKEEHIKYYQEHKEKFKSKYIKREKPRGRPRKPIQSE